MEGPARRTQRRRFLLRAAGYTLAVLAAVAVIVYASLRHPMPRGRPGPEAEALAHSLQRSVDIDAWERTGAVRWTFAGRNHHLWDRRRSFDRVRSRDLEVLLDIGRRTGRATRGGRVLEGAELRAALDRAYAMWANDSFWLNPVAKIFDAGTTRSIVTMASGPEELLVHYASGGVTPGDTYLWIPGADGRPRAWQMWVSVLPVPGAESSWEGWTRLRTGAWIATVHRMGPTTLRITDVDGAETLEQLEPGPDPFAAIASP